MCVICAVQVSIQFVASVNLYSPMVVSRLLARYIRELPTAKTGWSKHHVIQYVRLAFVEKEDVTLKDESLNEIIRLTLQGEVGKIFFFNCYL